MITKFSASTTTRRDWFLRQWLTIPSLSDRRVEILRQIHRTFQICRHLLHLRCRKMDIIMEWCRHSELRAMTWIIIKMESAVYALQIIWSKSLVATEVNKLLDGRSGRLTDDDIDDRKISASIDLLNLDAILMEWSEKMDERCSVKQSRLVEMTESFVKVSNVNVLIGNLHSIISTFTWLYLHSYDDSTIMELCQSWNIHTLITWKNW